jgi:gluconokinase
MVLIFIGVAGSGKTTLGQAMAEATGWPFLDGDDFHPPANIKKMKSGQPLDDHDRAPWLLRLRQEIEKALEKKRPLLMACSALKLSYREVLQRDDKRVKFIYLNASRELIRQRLEARPDHFMPAGLVDSQFEALEVPAGEALALDASLPAEALLEQVYGAFLPDEPLPGRPQEA